ncbi:transketolase family protein, partial [Patescibacteria group bacterium]|nr:transketolase family protein [Patescibacteria group bacterium]
VIVPCDSIESKKATYESAKIKGPVYLRFAREATPIMTTEDSPFKVGKANVLWDASTGSAQAAIIACGPMVYNALVAAKELEKEGIEIIVVNNHTIKPIDEKTLSEVAKKAGAVVTVEEHQVHGGMGSAVAEALAKNCPVPIEFVGIQDKFGESGQPEELLEKFGMGIKDIKQAVKRVIKRKK